MLVGVGVLSLILSIGFAVLIAYLVYWCLKNYGFKVALVANIVLQLISNILNGTNNQNILILIISSVISALLSTAIDYWIYKQTNSFGAYLLLSIALGLVLTFVLAGIFAVIFAGIFSMMV